MLGFSPLASTPLASSGSNADLRQLLLAATEAQDTAAISLDGSSFILLEASEAPDAVAFQTAIVAGIYLGATEAPDTAAFNAYVSELYLAATEAPDIAAMTIGAVTSVLLAAVETPDGVSLPLSVLWTPADDPTTDIWVRVDDGMPYNQTVI